MQAFIKASSERLLSSLERQFENALEKLINDKDENGIKDLYNIIGATTDTLLSIPIQERTPVAVNNGNRVDKVNATPPKRDQDVEKPNKTNNRDSPTKEKGQVYAKGEKLYLDCNTKLFKVLRELMKDRKKEFAKKVYASRASLEWTQSTDRMDVTHERVLSVVNVLDGYHRLPYIALQMFDTLFVTEIPKGSRIISVSNFTIKQEHRISAVRKVLCHILDILSAEDHSETHPNFVFDDANDFYAKFGDVLTLFYCVFDN